jgi:diadenylate cyclase
VSDAFDALFQDASARDIIVLCIDIFLVYYVIYRVLLTIKGTRAAQMVIGLFLIGAGFFAADRFEMTTVSWLLDNFINYFIIIIIVVFQQDIRRGLVRLGQNVFPFGRTGEVSHAIDEVVEAADHLAKARIGGIFAIERDAELTQFVEHGGVVDARVSKELLVALFVPSRDNELHDGAIIIDKGMRISRAGVVLPLSRQQMSFEFGTRHRAALGITEETDAVALVISEERGEISLCFGGNIARDLEPDALRSALTGLFYGEKKDSKRIAEEAHAAAELSKAMAALAEKPEAGESSRIVTVAEAAEVRPRSTTASPAQEPSG